MIEAIKEYKTWELKLTSRVNVISGEDIYRLEFGNITVKSYADSVKAEKQFQSLLDQDADTANGFLNLWNSLSYHEQLRSGIDLDTIQRIINLGHDQDRDSGYKRN